MKISLSDKKQGVLAIAGHAGSGHAHSHNNYSQDDSGGLVTVLSLFQQATGTSLVIKDIRVQTGVEGYIEVETVGGGTSRTTARRGITVQEGRLIKSLIGRDAIRTQTLVLEAFGRFYGQGVHETPVALQTAIANAALDTFVQNYPDKFKSCYEDVEGNCGLIAGTVLDFDDIPVSILGTVNASIDGLGPNEDLEGTAAIGKKRELMNELGMVDLPTIVVEGKVYSPDYSSKVEENSFLVRADDKSDNPIVAKSLINACEKLGYPVDYRDDVMARIPGNMEKKTKELGEKISQLGDKLGNAEYSQEKVETLAELATLISQDGAGISFMTNKLHDIIGGVGMNPGTGAVYSYIVPLDYQKEFVFPFITEEDIVRYVEVAKAGVQELYKVLPEAKSHVEKARYDGNLDEFVIFNKKD